MRLPGAICLGARKAGTSWIHACLKEHPEVCVPSHKELFFFCGNKIKKGLSWYESNFKENNRPIVVDTSVDYLPELKAPKRIKEACPDAKLFVVLRDPTERAVSHFQWAKFIKLIPQETSFMEAWRANMRRIRSWGHYDYWLLNYMDYYTVGKDLLVLFYDDIKSNPKQFMKTLYKFIGADDSFVPESLHRKQMPGAEKFWTFRKKGETKYEAYQRKRPEVLEENMRKVREYYKSHIKKLEWMVSAKTGW